MQSSLKNMSISDLEQFHISTEYKQFPTKERITFWQINPQSFANKLVDISQQVYGPALLESVVREMKLVQALQGKESTSLISYVDVSKLANSLNKQELLNEMYHAGVKNNLISDIPVSVIERMKHADLTQRVVPTQQECYFRSLEFELCMGNSVIGIYDEKMNLIGIAKSATA